MAINNNNNNKENNSRNIVSKFLRPRNKNQNNNNNNTNIAPAAPSPRGAQVPSASQLKLLELTDPSKEREWPKDAEGKEQGIMPREELVIECQRRRSFGS